MSNNTYHEIAEFLAQFENDPLKFALACFPWGKKGLEGHTGLDEWQYQYLKDLGDDLKRSKGKDNQVRLKAISSGHGIGKSCLVSILILWSLSTLVDSNGVVTANTANQLSQKTWRELSKWFQLFIGKPLFNYTATSIYSVDEGHEKTWRIDAVPWSKENSDAFAGLHNESKRILLIFDEASSIDDNIWEVAEGALTDKATPIIWSCFGNPTRSEGRFYECFHRHKDRWKSSKIDSRTVSITNKEQIQEWVDAYGEDSDFVRVRVKGEFPRQSGSQFISSEVIDQAQKIRLTPREYSHIQPIIGVDPARFGDDASVIIVRQGDHVFKPKRYRGIDLMELAGHVFDTYRQHLNNGVICVDGVGIGAGLVDFLKMRELPVIEVQSAAKAFDVKGYANKRAELYGKLRDWLNTSGTLPDDFDLSDQLKDLNYGFNGKLQVLLESKDDIRKRKGQSPDSSDALAYTFAYEQYKFLNMRSQPRRIVHSTWL